MTLPLSSVQGGNSGGVSWRKKIEYCPCADESREMKGKGKGVGPTCRGS